MPLGRVPSICGWRCFVTGAQAGMPVLVAFAELAWGVRLQRQVNGPREDSHENLYTFGSG